jgi:spore coat protein U-like protein
MTILFVPDPQIVRLLAAFPKQKRTRHIRIVHFSLRYNGLEHELMTVNVLSCFLHNPRVDYKRHEGSHSTNGGESMRQFKKQVWVLSIAAAALCLSAPSAHAGAASSSFPVSAAVAAVCTISTANLNFGNYDPITANLATHLDRDGSVTVTCTKGSQVWIDLDAGTHGPGVGTTRAMLISGGGTDVLNYELFSDAGRTTVWGSGNPSGGGLGFAPGPAVNKTSRVFPIHGRIPAAQDSAVGNYTDTVQATVNF